MTDTEILGLDIGEAWIGLARGSTLAGLAEPLTSIDAKQARPQLAKFIDQYQIKAIVAGLPRNLNGEDTAQTQSVRDFIARLKSEIGLPFYWQDEALTSNIAAAKRPGRKRPKNPVDEHALAATQILQDWLDTPEADRVGC